MSSRAIVVLGVVGLIVALGVLFAVFFGMQTLAVISVKRTAGKSPEMCVVPQGLEIASPADVPGTRFSYFGYEFELPWTDVEEEVRESSVRIDSDSGKIVLFFDPAQQLDIVEERVVPGPESREEVVALLGKPGYARYRDMLNATPDQLSVFMPREESFRVSVLLMMKALLAGSLSAPGLHSFEHGDLRGFQFGDPQAADTVIVHVFDKADQHLEFNFFAQDPDAKLSQDEINRLIHTLKRAQESTEDESAPTSLEAGAATPSTRQELRPGTDVGSPKPDRGARAGVPVA